MWLSKPLGNIHRYDFVLEGSGKLWRVQVKTTAHMTAGLYALHARCFTQQRLEPYSASDIDFLVGYVLPEDAVLYISRKRGGGLSHEHYACVPRTSYARGYLSPQAPYALTI